MLHSQHVHQFPLLGADALVKIRQLLAAAPFIDGKTTATDAAKAVKNNLQVDANDRQVLPLLQQEIGMSLIAETRFQTTFYASRLYQFIFSRCDAGMGYGLHVDSPIMGSPPVRTDLAMTVFLSDPNSYEGGELVIHTDGGEVAYKPEAGHAVVYPCQYLHSVNTVTKGTRLAAVTWMQSAVRSADQRQILAQVKQLHEKIAAADPQGAQAQELLQTWSNLLRMWAEV
jgi:PKHD-type hydroxylase